LFAYVRNNPIAGQDMDGHGPEPARAWGSWTGQPHDQAFIPTDITELLGYGSPPPAAQNTSQTETQPQPQTQTQPKQLSADDVAKGIQSAKTDTGSNAKKSVDFLNSFGTNWNLSGDALRQGLKDSKVDAHGVDKKVDSVSRTGDTVTVQLNKGINFLIYKTKTTITFDVGTKSGRPALVNIQGVEVFHGYHYVPKTDYGPD
jgi:hypothetical protein